MDALIRKVEAAFSVSNPYSKRRALHVLPQGVRMDLIETIMQQSQTLDGSRKLTFNMTAGLF